MSDPTRDRHLGSTDARETKLGNKSAEGAGIGGTIRAIAAAVAAIGTNLVLPGLGLVIAGPWRLLSPVLGRALRGAASSALSSVGHA